MYEVSILKNNDAVCLARNGAYFYGSNFLLEVCGAKSKFAADKHTDTHSASTQTRPLLHCALIVVEAPVGVTLAGTIGAGLGFLSTCPMRVDMALS